MASNDAKLYKIKDHMVVVIEGEEYLLVVDDPHKIIKISPNAKPKSKSKPGLKKTISQEDFKETVIEFLERNPNSKSGTIRSMLKDKFGVNLTSGSMSARLRTLKTDGAIEVAGNTGNATWSVKKYEATTINSLFNK